MADYFTNFSLILPLPTREAQEYAIDLDSDVQDIRQGEPVPEDFPESLREVTEDWNFDTEPSHPSDHWGIWLHTQNGGVDAVCAFIRHLLQRYNPEGCVSFEWSNDCSKPRIDAYGGGAAIVTAAEITTINTGQWLDQQLAGIQNKTTA